MAEESYDFDIVFIPDVEWDVAPISTSVPQTSTDVEVECVKPWETRAVQGCFCTKCTSYRN